MSKDKEQTGEEIARLLSGFDDADTKERIWQLGLLTGWRLKQNGRFGPANFERGLILEHLVERFEPKDILEIGTGRGFGCLAMAAAAERSGISVVITTVDVTPPDRPIEWPIRIENRDQIMHASRNEIWDKWIPPELLQYIHQLTGRSDAVLPELVFDQKSFDLVFIDGPHDPYSVMHDLTHSFHLLRRDGIVLMDDFAPLDQFGWGTCFALPSARRWFEEMSVFPTDGLVFGHADHTVYPRGMVFLKNKTNVRPRWNWTVRMRWRLANYFLRTAWRQVEEENKPTESSRRRADPST